MVKRLGPYQLERELGSGSLGKVYLAREEENGTPLALKIFDADIWSEQDAARSFLREAHFAFALRHRHIVECLQEGFEDGKLYLLMELLSGTDLQQYLNQNKFPHWCQSARIIQQACSALQYAHDNGVLHCDFNPTHIVLDAEEQTVITGFGMAYLKNEPIERRPEYMAPEMLSWEQVDGKVDTFSAAAILYELLTQTNPARQGTWSSVTAPDKINQEIPASLSDLVLKALSKKPQDRPTTGVFARQLSEILSQYSLSSKSSPNSEPVITQNPTDHSIPQVIEKEATPEQVTAVICSLPPEPEAKKALENLLRQAMPVKIEWLQDSVVSLYTRPLLGIEAAHEAVSKFILDNLSACIVTGSFQADAIWAEARPDLGQLACRNLERLHSMLTVCPPGKLRLDACSASYAPDSLSFSPVEGENDLVQFQDESETPPEPLQQAPLSLEARLGMTAARKPLPDLIDHVPSALRGHTDTIEIVKPTKKKSINWNNLISLLLLIIIGVAAYFGWPLLQNALQNGEIILTGIPAKLTVNITIDQQPAQTYKNSSAISLKPGEHRIRVMAKGYTTFEKKVSIKNRSTLKIPVKLVKSPPAKKTR